ncbi:hypothetical protein GF389_03285 [Candidatus Dojkabacteria bacterium]|nr:hypothetical protein [Candidatus Dojkabacteria bacterium]
MTKREQRVIGTISKYEDSDFTSQIRYNYNIMGLTDILPADTKRNINKEELKSFVSEIFKNLDQNELLKKECEVFQKRFDLLSEKEIVEAICWGICLERMTLALLNGPNLLSKTEELLNRRRQSLKKGYEKRLLLRLKVWSVCSATRQLIIKPLLRSPLSLWKFQFFLFINVLEAAIYDVLTGNFKNALRGFKLAFIFPIRFNRTTNNKKLEVHFKDTLEYVKRYELWNMMFLANFSTYHIAFMKLLIPSVSGFTEQPENFLPTRLVALYLYVNRSIMVQFLEPDI